MCVYIYIIHVYIVYVGWDKFPSTILRHFLELVGGFNCVFIICHPSWNDDEPIGVPCDTAVNSSTESPSKEVQV